MLLLDRRVARPPLSRPARCRARHAQTKERPTMKARILGCVALAGLTALVPAASAATKAHPAHRGVVVDWRAHSHTATLALPGGHLIAVHSARRVRPGTKVKFATLTQLGNGTFSGSLA